MVKSALAIAALCLSSYAYAASGAIGTATARGDMRIDGSSVVSNATLFEGSVIETTSNATTVRLDKGIQLILAPNSRGILYHDHLVLQQGQSEVQAAGPFRLEANGLAITATKANTHGVVATNGALEVGVKASSGSFHVASASAPVLDVNAGESMVFDYNPSGSLAGGGGGGGGWWGAHVGWVLGVTIAVGFTVAIIETTRTGYPASR